MNNIKYVPSLPLQPDHMRLDDAEGDDKLQVSVYCRGRLRKVSTQFSLGGSVVFSFSCRNWPPFCRIYRLYVSLLKEQERVGLLDVQYNTV